MNIGHCAFPSEPALRPRRVLFLLDDFGGGTGNHILCLLRHWDRSSWKPEIVSLRPVGTRVQPENIAISILPPFKWWEPFPIAHVRRFLLIWSHVRRRRPDVVHAYFFWSIMFGRMLKVLGTVGALVENREDLGFNWGRFEYACLRATRRLPDRVICVCDAVRSVVLERESLEPDRTVTIRNGVDAGEPPSCETGLRGELGIPEESKVVGMVANFNRKVKGVTYFLDAVPLILKEVPETWFLLIGRGPEEEELRNKALRMGIDHRLIFTGFREDIDRCYRAMDVSVLTSESEGLSITVLESMKWGIPVVATRVGGNPEIIIDNSTGFLVPPKDPVAFANKVTQVLLDQNLRRGMGMEARRRVMDAFDLAKVTGEYLDVYKSIEA